MKNILHKTLVILILIIIFIIIVSFNFDSFSNYLFGGQNITNPKGDLAKIIVQILGGIILLLGAFYSLEIANSMNDNNILIEKGNIAERFKNAIHMLDDNNSSTCLGGIYALNNIAKDNEDYREQVFHILVEFINNKTNKLPSWVDIPKPDRFSIKPAIEIKTIVKLLFSKHNSIYKNFNANIENAKLYGAEFSDCNFSRCTFKNVEFQNSFFLKTWFIECEIFNTDFTFSDFSGAFLTGSTIRDNTILACCGFYSTRFTGCFIQNTEFICSRISDSLFDGAMVYHSSFNGVHISFSSDRGCFNGASFASTSIKGLKCGSLIARGAQFEAGVYATRFRINIKGLIGEKAIIKTENILEELPKAELDRFENLIDISEKGYCHTLRSIKTNDKYKATGWVFADTGIFTNNDYKNALKNYDNAIKYLAE